MIYFNQIDAFIPIEICEQMEIISVFMALFLSSTRSICRAITFYLTTTVSAVILGIILVTTIRPGVLGSDNTLTTNKTERAADSKRVYTPDTLLDLIR